MNLRPSTRMRRNGPPRSMMRDRAAEARRYLLHHRRPRRPRGALLPLALRTFGLGTLLGVALLFAEQGANGFTALVASLERGVSELLPAPVLERRLPESPAASPLSGAPILDPFDTLTREPRFTVTGRLPAYVLEGESPRVEILVNGALAALPTTDERGRFTATVSLIAGPNVVTAAAVRPGDRATAAARTVVLDTTPPPLELSRPGDGASVEGTSVAVEGRTEPGASVTLNGRSVSVAPDGSFVETLPAPQPGSFAIEAVARDQAGNETKKTLSVLMKQAAPAVGLGVTVTLDRAKAKPGETVISDVLVTDGGVASRDVSVSIAVGLSTVGSGRTDASGHFRVSFAVPSVEGFVQVVALATNGASSGRAASLLEVSKPSP